MKIKQWNPNKNFLTVPISAAISPFFNYATPSILYRPICFSRSLSLPLRPHTLTPTFKHLEIYLVLSEPYDILYVLEPFHQFHFDFSFNYINFYFEVNACVYIPGKITIIGFIYYLTEHKYGSCFLFFFFNFGIEKFDSMPCAGWYSVEHTPLICLMLCSRSGHAAAAAASL